MVIVRLEDDTTYYIDTDSAYVAVGVVDHKLRDRIDFRGIKSADVLKDTIISKDSKYYNSADCYDGVPLKCKTGWSYKWSDTSCAEFR